MNNEPEIEESFASEAGSPTLTVRLGKEERMIPWASLLSGRFAEAETKLELWFQDFHLELRGRDLGPLWQACQMQDVRWIRVLEPSIADLMAGDCVVTALQLNATQT